MKTLKKVPLQLVEVDYIPEVQDMVFGLFYFAPQWNASNHLCPCGCGSQTPLPIKDGEWNIQNKENLTIGPSVQHRYNCLSHYVITEGNSNMLNEPIAKEFWVADSVTHAPGSCPM